MKTTIIITVSVILGVFVLFLTINHIMSYFHRKLEKLVLKKFNKKEIIGATTRANFFGKLSRGGKQLRGNGALVLTKDKLFFIRALPEKEYVIPVTSITKITLPTSFNGRSVFSELLCVHYRDTNRTETMAWAVENPKKWQLTIEKLTMK